MIIDTILIYRVTTIRITILIFRATNSTRVSKTMWTPWRSSPCQKIFSLVFYLWLLSSNIFIGAPVLHTKIVFYYNFESWLHFNLKSTRLCQWQGWIKTKFHRIVLQRSFAMRFTSSRYCFNYVFKKIRATCGITVALWINNTTESWFISVNDTS
jgi:hypothetical protein